MHDELIPGSLNASARRLTAQALVLDELSEVYAQADEAVADGGALVSSTRAKRAQNWAMALRRYEDFWAESGHAAREHTRNGATLPAAERRMGEWARYQRRFDENLCRYQVIRLDVSPAFIWDPHDHVWQQKLDACVDLARTSRRLPYLNGSDPLEFSLARWLGRQLRQLQMGTLEPVRAARLAVLFDARQAE